MKIDFIQIQSLLIIDAIEPILAEVGLRPADKSKVKIKSPFKELYFAYPSILALAHQQHLHTDLKSQLSVLLKVMDELLSDMSLAISALQTKKKISFEYLWTIFPKDIIVYSRVDDQDRLYQVVQSYSGSVLCRYVQFDGSIFGMSRQWLYISSFDGARSISDLSVYPIGFHPDPNLEKRLAERGRQTLDFQGICYREYSGVGREESNDDDGDPITTKYQVCAHRHIEAGIVRDD